MSQKQKDSVTAFLVYGSSFFTVAVLVIILGFIFINGIPHINMKFLTSDYENKTTYVNVPSDGTADSFEMLGLQGSFNESGQWEIKDISSDSPVNEAVDMTGASWKVKKGDVITKVGSQDIEAMKDAKEEEKSPSKLILVRPKAGSVLS